MTVLDEASAWRTKATDVRAWWPACTSYDDTPRETR